MKYKIYIAESLTYRQFGGTVEADSEEDAIKKGKETFLKEYPIYSAHLRIYCMGHKIQYDTV